MTKIYWISPIWLALLLPVAAQEYEIDWDRLHHWGQQAWERWAPLEWQQEYELWSPQEWRALEAKLLSALQGSDLQALAALWPDLEAASEWLAEVPGIAPYLDWLEPRLDYARAAHETAAPPTPRLSPPETPPAPVPRPAPAPPPVPVPVQPNAALLRDTAYWQERLAGQAPPARSQAWAPRLQQIFEEEGVPGHWIWLAEVESSFNPQARSPVGATGLFQFMPATAERFGLRLTPTDDRLDPFKSGRAAAQYLRLLHRRFDSWPLALAAYNAGEGRVGRALRDHGGTRFEAIAPFLPTETQLYVPKVLATVTLRAGIDPLAQKRIVDQTRLTQKQALAGYWSFRLTHRDRIVYSIDESTKTVFIHRTKTHCGE